MNVSKENLIKILNGDSDEINRMRELLCLNGKLCKCCGTHFIPEKRVDEIYCSKCRKIGHDKTLPDRERSYRREYKRLYASYMRGKITKKEMQVQYEQYRKESEEK